MTKKRRLHIHCSITFFALALVFTGVGVTHAQDTRATGQSKWTKLDGARIHYVNYGKGGEALVLIHGWTQNIDAWRDQMAEFARRGRVIAIDLPGHGQSDKPTEAKGKGESAKGKSNDRTTALYSMDHFARAVDAVMRDAKVKRAVLMGHSMGTPVSRQFYRKYPDKTLGIVIVDGALRPFFDQATMDGLLAGLRGANYRATINQMFAMLMGPNLPAETQERIKSATANTPQTVLVSAMDGMADASIWSEDKVNVPVLAIMAKTPLFPPDIEQRYRTIAPNMEFHMWEGIGHFIMMEKPKEFNAAVSAWLDKNKLVVGSKQ